MRGVRVGAAVLTLARARHVALVAVGGCRCVGVLTDLRGPPWIESRGTSID